MSDIIISFYAGNETIGAMESSLETFDVNKHTIPNTILNNIRNRESVGIFFAIDYGNTITDVEKLDKNKLIQWMYENGYFSLKSADMLTDEINKGTFTI